MYKGKVTRLLSCKNEFYRVEYSDKVSKHILLEKVRHIVYVYLKNVESEDIAEQNYFSTNN